ncbi:MAG: hypothetical protein ACI8W8_000067, partial [Rhodothermales bacterium]
TANPASVDGTVIGIDWAEVGVAESAIIEAVTALDLSMTRCLQAGGDWAADAATIAEIAKLEEPVVLVVKAWEPPMADVLDFLEDLRTAIGDREIVVLALGENATPALAEHYRIWQLRCAGLGDEHLSVRSL